jgi:hypothetical protein
MQSDVKEELDDDHHYENEIDKELEEQNCNTINSNLKGSQLIMLRMNFVKQLRMIWMLRLNLKLMNSVRSMLNK